MAKWRAFLGYALICCIRREASDVRRCQPLFADLRFTNDDLRAGGWMGAGIGVYHENFKGWIHLDLAGFIWVFHRRHGYGDRPGLFDSQSPIVDSQIGQVPKLN